MLKQRAISATVWSGADMLLRQGLQFGVGVALARILSPEEFGTIALLYLFTGIASTFVDGGFSAALIRQQDTSHTDESTVFWFNLVIGIAMAVALAASAPVIATFFDLPVLVPLTWAMSANILISALGSIHGTLLTKKLDFRVQMKVGAVASIVSGAIAIWMAVSGYGVWALALQIVTASSITTALLWHFSSWRPKVVFSIASARRLFAFGGYMLASGLLDILYNRIYTLLIGKFYGARELGFYNRADNTKQLPIGILTGILARVAFPIFAAAAHDLPQLRRGVRLSLRGMMLLNVPMMIGLATTAEPVIDVVFGRQWLPTVPVLQVLCIAGIFWPLHVINLNVLMAQGFSHLFFRIEVLKKVIGTLFLVAGSFYGVMGIAWSQVAFGAAAFLINAHYSRKYLDYGVLDQTRDVIPILAVATAMAVIVLRIGMMWNGSSGIALLATQVIAGGLVFFLLAWACRLDALREVTTILSERAGFPALTRPGSDA